MNTTRTLITLTVALCSLAVAASALAGPPRSDLELTLGGPASGGLNDVVSVSAAVENIGARSARDVALTIPIPAAATVSGYPSACSASASALTCTWGRLRAGRSEVVSFDLTLPGQAGPVTLSGAVTTSSADADPGNNADAITIDVEAPQIPLSGGEVTMGAACYGSGPLVFADCEAAPSSILTGTFTINANGTATPDDPNYSATWSQADPTQLLIVVTENLNNTVVSTWTGSAVTANCFQGTIATSSGWYGAWEGCF